MNHLNRVVLLGATAAFLLLGGAPRAAAQVGPIELHGDGCWNYWIVPCPEPYDYHWRPATPFSPQRPADWAAWATTVAPIETSFFLEPLPRGKREEHNFALAGWGYEWTVVPAGYWRFGDGDTGYGQVSIPMVKSTSHRYERSSYARADRNPVGEPSYPTSSVVVWLGDLWFWHVACSLVPPACWIEREDFPMGAWQERRHPLAVRQVLAVEVGY
jgi:hypothetical protein